MKVLVAQSCLTLCDPMHYSPPGSSVHGILQARILEWIAMPFSKKSSQPRDWTWVSCVTGGFFTVWVIREAQSQTCTHTKKKTHSHCMMICCWSDPLQLSESWQSHYIWEVYSTNRRDRLKMAMPAASIGKQNGPSSFPQQCPTACHTTNASNVEQIELQSFASSAVFT